MIPNPRADRVTIAFEEPGLALVRLFRADRLNALDLPMFEAIVETGHVLANRSGLRCVVLAGEGRGFCAGLDLAMFETFAAADAPRLVERSHGNANLFQQAALLWRKLPVPVIAAIHGPCLGGGLQIAGGADIRVVAPDARLAVAEAGWGLVPDMGHFALWRSVVRDDVLRELTWTAREFSGAEAVTLGFATHADPDPLARALDIARTIAGQSPDAVRAAKALFAASADAATDRVLVEESVAQQALLGSRNQIEAARARLERRAPDFGQG